MYNLFKEWLKEKGYSEFSKSGNLSTCTDYPNRINYIIWYENLSSWQDVVNNIDVLLPAYSKGGKREKIGQKSHNAVINALRRFCEFIIDKNITPQKTKKLILKDKSYEYYNINDEEIKIIASIYTIKYLDNGEIIKVTTDKNKENSDVLYYDTEKTPLMQKIIGKNKGDIITIKFNDDDIIKIEIIDIEI